MLQGRQFYSALPTAAIRIDTEDLGLAYEVWWGSSEITGEVPGYPRTEKTGRKGLDKQFQHASADDPVLVELRRIIRQCWPASNSKVPNTLHLFYDFRDELTTQKQLVFKGSLVVVPVALRQEMMAMCHDTHIGVEGCIRRARESLFWPRMATGS